MQSSKCSETGARNSEIGCVIDELESSVYRDADVVIFDSFHWWVDGKTNNGINYFQEGNYLHLKMEILKAFKKGHTTWRKCIYKNIDSKKTQVVFRGYSETHYVSGGSKLHTCVPKLLPAPIELLLSAPVRCCCAHDGRELMTMRSSLPTI